MAEKKKGSSPIKKAVTAVKKAVPGAKKSGGVDKIGHENKPAKTTRGPATAGAKAAKSGKSGKAPETTEVPPRTAQAGKTRAPSGAGGAPATKKTCCQIRYVI